MVLLCGPGATTNALSFWGIGIDSFGQQSFYDYSAGLSTTWNNTYNRSFIMHIGWQIKAPSWSGNPGMMDSTVFPSYGVTQYRVRDALNWEASGQNSST